MMWCGLLFLFATLLWLRISNGEVTQDQFACRRTLPTEGIFIAESPFYVPKYCPKPKHFDEHSAAHCLRNRTVYVMGNSLGRQYLFNLVEILGGDKVDREEQKKLCPKLSTNWDANSCHTDLKGVNFKYLFFKFMDGFDYHKRGGFPFLTTSPDTHINTVNKLPSHANDFNPPADHGMDNCNEQEVTHCLRNFFHDAKKDDILIFSLGFAYCEQRTKLVDYEAWLRASASAFRTNINRIFPGTIFHVNNADIPHVATYPTMDACMKLMERHLWEVWHPSSFAPDEKPWYHIDQFNINVGRSDGYNDGLHFIGPLSHAAVQQVLNEMCPNDGIPLKNSALPEHKDKIITNSNTNEVYFVDSEGYFHRLPPSSGACLHVLKHTSTVFMTGEQFDALHALVSPFPNICNVGTGLRFVGDSTIYLVQDDALRPTRGEQVVSNRQYHNNLKTMPANYFPFFKVANV